MGLPALLSPTREQTHTVSIDAPAKINLILEVLGRRGDGYHDIRSLAVGVGLHDRITGSIPNREGLTLQCSEPTLDSGDNLVSRAALAVARAAGCDPQIRLRLEKRIPIAAGLGGGSSDAAGTMQLCNRIWGAAMSTEALIHLGAELGSDVPLFFRLPAVETSGRGECAAPVSLAWSGWALLVTPPIHVSTARVYGAWQAGDVARSHSICIQTLCAMHRADELNEHRVNQLEPAVYRVAPKVKWAQEAVESLGVPATRVTGSGSTFFRLYDDEDRARHDARKILDNISGMRVDIAAAPVNMPRIEERET
jgi:4-diphosphocytidyl-2-C-methyl-D-erythritol kinase